MLQRASRQTQDKYKDSRRKANRVIRIKKREYLKKEIENIEMINNQNDTRKFFQEVKK